MLGSKIHTLSTRVRTVLLWVVLTPIVGSAAEASGASAWALIVNGDDSFTHRRNVEVAVDSLMLMGYGSDHVLLMEDGPPPRSGLRVVAATKHGWRDALSLLEARLRPGDTLLVYLTGHGSKRLGESMLHLRHGFLDASGIVSSLGRLPYGTLILIADPCYSGGFVKAAAHAPRIVAAVSSTDRRHKTRCEPFARPFWRAASDPRSDLNGDGMVSVGEAVAVTIEVMRFALGRLPPEIREDLHETPEFVVRGVEEGMTVPFLPDAESSRSTQGAAR